MMRSIQQRENDFGTAPVGNGIGDGRGWGRVRIAPSGRPGLWQMRGIALAVAFCGVGGCAHRIPLPSHLRALDAADVRQRVQAARSAITAYSADARLTYFGARGRLKTSASLVVMLPDRVRYDVRGPHGGVVAAFAMGDGELQLVDFRTSRFLYGKATPATIDATLNLVPLGLEPRGWVTLLFGDLQIPAAAKLDYDDRRGRFLLSWDESAQQRRVEVDPISWRPVRATLRAGSKVLWEVAVKDWDHKGIPVGLHMRAAAEEVDIEVKLRDVEHMPDVGDDIFVISPPRGMIPEYVE